MDAVRRIWKRTRAARVWLSCVIAGFAAALVLYGMFAAPSWEEFRNFAMPCGVVLVLLLVLLWAPRRLVI